MKKVEEYIVYKSNREFIEAVNERNYDNVGTDEIPLIIEQVKSLEYLSQNKKTIIILACIKSSKIYYISNNVTHHLGYEPEELAEKNDKGLFKLFSESSLSLPLTTFQWAVNVQSQFNVSKKDLNSFFFGIKMQHKTGEESTYFSRAISLSNYNDENSLLLCFYQDINHLMKRDFFWAYYVVRGEKKHTRFFSLTGSENGIENIITKREKEILEQINFGKSSKEISKSLEISVNTVERHRKNMIAKLGAKDSTALLQLCKMCGVL